MSSFSKTIILGNLGADPDLKFLPSGQAVAEFSVATTERWTDKNGQKQEETEWHRCKIFGKQAEALAKYMTKGKQVLVEGRNKTRSWEKDGVKRYMTEVVATSVQFLGGGRRGGENSQIDNNHDASAPSSGGGMYGGSDPDDIPFITAENGTPSMRWP